MMTQSGIHFTMLYLITQSSLNTYRTIVARSSHSLLRKEKKTRLYMIIIDFFRRFQASYLNEPNPNPKHKNQIATLNLTLYTL